MRLRILQLLLLGLLIVAWYVMTAPGLIPPFYFDKANRAAFFFGEPQKVFWVIFDWFASGEIFPHLGITLLETALGFVIGAAAGLGIGLWLALSPTASAITDPYIKGFNSMPRPQPAPITKPSAVSSSVMPRWGKISPLANQSTTTQKTFCGSPKKKAARLALSK